MFATANSQHSARSICVWLWSICMPSSSTSYVTPTLSNFFLCRAPVVHTLSRLYRNFVCQIPVVCKVTPLFWKIKNIFARPPCYCFTSRTVIAPNNVINLISTVYYRTSFRDRKFRSAVSLISHDLSRPAWYCCLWDVAMAECHVTFIPRFVNIS